jgi:AraC-like DNA-binding protein
MRVVEYVRAPVPAPLRGLVTRCTGYRLEGFAPAVHRGLPGRGLTVVVSLAGPLDLSYGPSPTPAAQLPALAAGLHAGPVLIRHDGHQVGIQLELTPSGARALLGAPAAALSGISVDLAGVLGPAGSELQDRVRELPTWAGRFAVLDEILLRLVAGHDGAARATSAVPAEVRHAWRRLVGTGGQVSVEQLASEVGWSRRHLTGRFVAEVGLPPKVLARVVRFERARDALAAGEHPTIAAVAAACGFADQSHLTRDFRELAGCSPTQWLAEEVLPFVQDAGASGSPSWTHGT